MILFYELVILNFEQLAKLHVHTTNSYHIQALTSCTPQTISQQTAEKQLTSGEECSMESTRAYQNKRRKKKCRS